MTITPKLRGAVRSAYGYRCGYCGVSETLFGGELEIDHYQPLIRGGSDAPDNLIYACTTCNRFKGSYWPDENATSDLYLLHPGKDDLATHVIEATNGRLVGLTVRGWFHINWLHLNRPQLLELRQLQQNERAVVEALTQGEQMKTSLQEQVRVLEAELTELRKLIARLT
ncbi:MAG: HNH endonuclease [Chloroflexota bacterium]